jgi:hypothetical protein
MLASIPASILNQNQPDLGIPNRLTLKASRSSGLAIFSGALFWWEYKHQPPPVVAGPSADDVANKVAEKIAGQKWAKWPTLPWPEPRYATIDMGGKAPFGISIDNLSGVNVSGIRIKGATEAGIRMNKSNYNSFNGVDVSGNHYGFDMNESNHNKFNDVKATGSIK